MVEKGGPNINIATSTAGGAEAPSAAPSSNGIDAPRPTLPSVDHGRLSRERDYDFRVLHSLQTKADGSRPTDVYRDAARNQATTIVEKSDTIPGYNPRELARTQARLRALNRKPSRGV